MHARYESASGTCVNRFRGHTIIAIVVVWQPLRYNSQHSMHVVKVQVAHVSTALEVILL